SMENADHEALAALRQYAQAQPPYLLVTPRRAEALGLDSGASAPLALDTEGLSLEELVQLANPTTANSGPALRAHEDLAQRVRQLPAIAATAALELAKLARLLPSVLLLPVSRPPEGVLRVTATQIKHYRSRAAL